MSRLFIPRKGWVVLVTQVGEFSAQADTGKIGEVVEARESSAFPGWLSLTLDCAGKPWVCEMCRCQLAPAKREVA